MKTILVVLLLGLSLCSYSQEQASSGGLAIERVQPGKVTVWRDGALLRIAKRDGVSVEGIQLVRTASNGEKFTVTADTGTISSGSVANATDANCVTLTLHDAHGVTFTPTGGIKLTTMSVVAYVLKN